LKEVGVVELRPNMEGRDMLMILAPNKDIRQGSEKQ